MNNPLDVPPPGASRLDPAKPDIDAVGLALSRVRCYLLWIGDHHADFLRSRSTKPEWAERELAYLTHSIGEAKQHYWRLLELLLAGYTFDPSKENPMAGALDDEF